MDTWTVEQDGTGDFLDIQPAVDAASAGDTIRIGPGRFDTFRPFTAPAWTEQVVVGVTKNDLTFIGSGMDVTFVGPASMADQPSGTPKCFCSIDMYDGTLRDMTISNVQSGIYWWKGHLNVYGCKFTGEYDSYRGILISADGLTVSGCEFVSEHIGGGGISICENSTNIEVLNSHFTGPGLGVIASFATGVTVSSCTFTGTVAGVRFSMGTNGLVQNCEFYSATNYGIGAGFASTMEAHDLTIRGGRLGVDVGFSSQFTGTNIVLEGTTERAIFAHGASVVSLHNSHILPSSGLAVYCGAYIYDTVYQDLTNNYWGTSDADVIAELIWDGNDDSSVLSFVDYEPFSAHPLPTEETTWGDLKAMYRGE